MSNSYVQNLREATRHLGNSLSQMVMGSVKGDQTKLKEHCAGVVRSTNDLIKLSKAIAQSYPNLLPGIINAIKLIATQIENFIDAFTKFSQDRDDQKNNIIFSECSKQFANSIVALNEIVDRTSRPRMIHQIKKTLMNVSELEQLIQSESVVALSIQRSCQSLETNMKHLIGATTDSLNQSENKKKTELYNQGLDLLEKNSILLTDGAKKFARTQEKQDKDTTLDYGRIIGEAIGHILSALKIPENSIFQSFYSAIEYIQVLVSLAKTAEKESRGFRESYKSKKPDLILRDHRKAVLETLNNIVTVSQSLMNKEVDPIKRAFLEKTTWEFEDLVPEFKRSAEAALDKSPLADGMLAQTYDSIKRSCQRVLDGVDDTPDKDFKAALNTLSLTDLTEVRTEKAMDNTTFVFSSSLKFSEVQDTNKLFDKIMQDTFDPKIKSKLSKQRDEIIQTVNYFILCQRELFSAPSATIQKEFESTRTKLINLIGDTNVKFIEDSHMKETNKDNLSEKERIMRDLPTHLLKAKGDNQLVLAAKEHILAAHNLVREADKIAYTLQDEALSKTTDELYVKMEAVREQLLKSAQDAAKCPEDLSLLSEFRRQQQEINLIATEVALSSAPEMTMEAVNSLKESAVSETSPAFDQFQKYLDSKKEMKTVFEEIAPGGKTNLAGLIDLTEQVNQKAKNVSTVIKLLADTCGTDARILQRSLMDYAGSLVDNGMKLKILAKGVSSQEEDKAGKIPAAIGVFEATLKEVDVGLSTLFTKERAKQIQEQTNLLEKISEEVRSHRSITV